MLFLCFIGVRLETLASIAVFQLPFTIICLGMLSFGRVCCDMVAFFVVVWHPLFFWFVTHRFICLRSILFCERGGCCIRFAVGSFCLCPFSSVCFRLFVFLRACAGSHRLLLSSDATVVFVGVSCGEPGGNEQMAHSQIVVAIVFSFFVEMDVAVAVHLRLLGNVGFSCRD